MVDSEETCMVVMVYNTADSWGVLIGDTVVIPEPHLKRQSITHKDQVSIYLKKKKAHNLHHTRDIPANLSAKFTYNMHTKCSMQSHQFDN